MKKINSRMRRGKTMVIDDYNDEAHDAKNWPCV